MMKIRITAERYGGEYVVGSIPSSTAWYWAKEVRKISSNFYTEI